jgi:hypothetical protein
MEIEFNPGRLDKTGANQPEPVNPRPAAKAAAEPVAFEQVQSLEQALKNIPEVRSDKVEQAKALIANVQYPPQELISRIADLLAMYAQNQ